MSEHPPRSSAATTIDPSAGARSNVSTDGSVDTPDHILEAAAAVIVREGLRGASLRSVAQEAEVSLGLLSYHFDDKQTLIREAFKRATDILLDRSLDAMEKAGSSGEGSAGADLAEAQVEAYVRGAFDDDFLASEYLHLRISLWATARTDEDLAKVERDLYQRYAKNLAAVIAKARPELPPGRARQRATDVIVVQNGLWLNWARYHDRDDLERGLKLAVSIALA